MSILTDQSRPDAKLSVSIATRIVPSSIIEQIVKEAMTYDPRQNDNHISKTTRANPDYLILYTSALGEWWRCGEFDLDDLHENLRHLVLWFYDLFKGNECMMNLAVDVFIISYEQSEIFNNSLGDTLRHFLSASQSCG
jgi:hypothetical protein